MESLDESGGLTRLGDALDSGTSPGQDDARSIAIMSGKGGVGKTTTALNMGAAIADQGRHVVLMDMDLDTSNLPIELGYISSGSTTIQDLLTSDMDTDVMSAVNRVRERLGIVPSSLSQEHLDWHPDDLNTLLDDIGKWVLIDTPPGIGEKQLKLVKSVDAVIVVITPSESAFIDGMKVVALAEEAGADILGVVVNRADGSRYDLSVDEIEAALDDIDLLGVIPDDARVKKTRQANKPLIDIDSSAPAAIAYQELAARLTGADYTPPNVVKRLLGKVKR